jgi:hypothetical protein
MSPLTCPDVEARLDLYAADECDPPESEAIRRHLAHCPRCATACEEARQLVGLLDLRLQEPERLGRLEARLAAEEAPRRRVLRFPVTARRAAALAAMLLLNVALAGWLAPGLRLADGDGGLVAALRADDMKSKAEALFAPDAQAARAGPKATKEPERDQPPPAIGLRLELRNTTDRPMRVWVNGPQTELHFDVSGPGVVSKQAKDAAESPPRAVTLRPGESHVIPIDRLTDGRRSWYWTKPGDYTVAARFTTRASIPGLGDRRITTRSAPVTIHVDTP